jgi:hypothetical protein
MVVIISLVCYTTRPLYKVEEVEACRSCFGPCLFVYSERCRMNLILHSVGF